MMENRLELARKLLNDKGAMFVSIDDNEQAYLKVLMDEVFNGGDNFVASISWKQFHSVKMMLLIFQKILNTYYVIAKFF